MTSEDNRLDYFKIQVRANAAAYRRSFANVFRRIAGLSVTESALEAGIRLLESEGLHVYFSLAQAIAEPRGQAFRNLSEIRLYGKDILVERY